MKVVPTALDGVVEVQTITHGDDRGWFRETFRKDLLSDAGIDIDWVQGNESFSAQPATLRGIHWQTEPNAQDKLVRVVSGAIHDVAVDLRVDSPTFGHHVVVTLSPERGNQLLIPKGFGHGFVTTATNTHVIYAVSAPYSPEDERAIRWNDPDLAIAWGLAGSEPVLSDKDAAAPSFSEVFGSRSSNELPGPARG